MKKVLIIIFSCFLLGFFLLLLINFLGLNLYNQKNENKAEISGKADSEFIAETVSDSKIIEYIFTPKTEEEKDYLLSYKLEKDGELVDAEYKKSVTGISKDNPIAFRIIRDNNAKYSLQTVINDNANPAIELHNDKIIIYPQEKEASDNNQESQIIPRTDEDVDNCEERGGIIMFPSCVGCEPYCSFGESEIIKKTLDDDSICVDNCGNGVCEEMVCLGSGCPCAEAPENCPADCD